ncbi:pyrimidine reductase family protein [Microbacterium caowuchunii]|uniref:pyrimidine reductase family protein n=1 Tax=Microbacterium caowuchunii TaxID=2614638 RepID=UPI001247DE57|nr:pyrimidine reductase family protein [Microbacterium caowuchunii]QEW00869.1 pyrimidine reductase family protein [Microbacterium caowuchunii]
MVVRRADERDSPPLDLSGIAALHAPPAGRRSPWIRANFVVSADGAAVGPDGRSGSLSSESDRLVFRALRCRADAVLVGAGTVRAEGYEGPLVDDEQVKWRVAHGLREQPVLVIVSGRLELDPAMLASSPVRPIVVTSMRPSEAEVRAMEKVAQVERCGGDRVDPAHLRDVLVGLGFYEVSCEGGPTFFGGMSAAAEIDELCLTVSPVLCGGLGSRMSVGDASALPLMLGHILVGDGGDLHLRYLRAES